TSSCSRPRRPGRTSTAPRPLSPSSAGRRTRAGRPGEGRGACARSALRGVYRRNNFPRAGVGNGGGTESFFERPVISLVHFDHDARDVVPGALVEGELAEAVCALLHVALVGDEQIELVVRDDAGEAVGAE